jgi:hypothetical protein
MKLVARIAAALALLAFATPALPCGAAKTTTASKETKKEHTVAKAEAKKTEARTEQKANVKVKAAAETKTATAND